MRYSRTTKGDLPEGASLDDIDEAVLSEVLVDHVDLDGDKVGEVVTMTLDDLDWGPNSRDSNPNHRKGRLSPQARWEARTADAVRGGCAVG